MFGTDCNVSLVATAAAATPTLPPLWNSAGTSGNAVCAFPTMTLCASSSTARASSLFAPTSIPEPITPIDDPSITSPSISERSFMEELACGIMPLRDGASPRISDMHGLSVTTTSPNSVTVSSLIFTCSSESFAPLTIVSILRTWASSCAYALAYRIWFLRCACITFWNIVSCIFCILPRATSSFAICTSNSRWAPAILFVSGSSLFTLSSILFEMLLLPVLSQESLSI